MISNKLILSVTAAFIVIFTLLVQNGEAIKCIECSTEMNIGKCNDTMKVSNEELGLMSVDCGVSTNKCRKLRTKIGNYYKVRRGCFFEGQTDTLGAEVIVCEKTNNCNSGNFLNFNMITITLGLVAAIVYKFIRI